MAAQGRRTNAASEELKAVGTISAAGLKKIGPLLGGEHWQSDVARGIDFSKSMITKVITGTRDPDDIFTSNLRRMVVDRIEKLGKALSTKGLPYAASPQVAEAQALIAQAVALLNGA